MSHQYYSYSTQGYYQQQYPDQQQKISVIENELQQEKKENEALKLEIEKLKKQIEDLKPVLSDKYFVTSAVSLNAVHPQQITPEQPMLPLKQTIIDQSQQPLKPLQPILSNEPLKPLQPILSNEPLKPLQPILSEEEMIQKFTLENIKENFEKYAPIMHQIAQGKMMSKFTILYKMRPEAPLRFDFEEALKQHPKLVTIIMTGNLVISFGGELNQFERQMIKDPAFKVNVLMHEGKFKKGMYIKSKSGYGYDCSLKKNEYIISIRNIFSIQTRKLIEFEKDTFKTEKTLQENCELGGGFTSFFKNKRVSSSRIDHLIVLSFD